MDYDELENLWKRYDSKLDKLEKLNRKLVIETITKKPQKKLNWLQFHNYYGLIIPPIVAVLALHPLFKSGNYDAIFISGAILVFAVLGYITWFYIKGINVLKKVDLINDTVIESASKVNIYKKMISLRENYVLFSIGFVGVMLMEWHAFNFNRNTIIFLIALCVFAFSLGGRQFRNYKKRIDRLLADINELKEYKE